MSQRLLWVYRGVVVVLLLFIAVEAHEARERSDEGVRLSHLIADDVDQKLDALSSDVDAAKAAAEDAETACQQQ